MEIRREEKSGAAVVVKGLTPGTGYTCCGTDLWSGLSIHRPEACATRSHVLASLRLGIESETVKFRQTG
jgi:hypothetical protein